jgi:ribosomal protein L32
MLLSLIRYSLRTAPPAQPFPNINAIVNSLRNNFQPQFQLLGPDIFSDHNVEKADSDSDNESLFGGLWFAAPKSKISSGKKKQKHLKYIPDKVAWVKCARCGEAKQPHRICTTNLEICALREEEYMLVKADYVVKKPEMRY